MAGFFSKCMLLLGFVHTLKIIVLAPLHVMSVGAD